MEQRQIKFRVWDGHTKSYMHKDRDMHYLPTIEVDEETGELYLATKDGSYDIQMCTGLKDKNGMEIYERDIMRVLDEVGQVYYDENNVCFCIDVERDYNPCIGRYEVIGNIYEHPHLLSHD